MEKKLTKQAFHKPLLRTLIPTIPLPFLRNLRNKIDAGGIVKDLCQLQSRRPFGISWTAAMEIYESRNLSISRCTFSAIVIIQFSIGFKCLRNNPLSVCLLRKRCKRDELWRILSISFEPTIPHFLPRCFKLVCFERLRHWEERFFSLERLKKVFCNGSTLGRKRNKKQEQTYSNT